MSGRLPRYSRVDLSATVLRSFWQDNLTVFFLSVMNALDRSNVQGFRYSPDYKTRIDLETPLPRAIYFGVTTSLPL